MHTAFRAEFSVSGIIYMSVSYTVSQTPLWVWACPLTYPSSWLLQRMCVHCLYVQEWIQKGVINQTDF